LKIDELYKDLLIAQLDKDWGRVAKIQKEINSEESREVRLSRQSCSEGSGEEGEGQMAEDTEDVWYRQGTVR